MPENVIGGFDRNKAEEVRARFGEYNGHEFADFRIYAPGAEGEKVPTKKGLTVRLDQLEQFRDLVDLAIEARDGGRHAG